MFFRANLDAMDRWATDGTPPPPSRIPTRADGTLVSIDEWRRQFPAIPGIATPRAPNALPLLDFGPDVERGILKEPPDMVPASNTRCWCRRWIATATTCRACARRWWRRRSAPTPAGIRVRAATAMARSCASRAATSRSRNRRRSAQATGDPRLSILERYPDKAAYVAAITAAARELVAQGLMLEEDVERCAAAAANWGRPRHDVSLD